MSLPTDGAALTALTTLTRLAQRQPEARGWLYRALSGRCDSLAEVAAEVAVETGDPIGRTMAELLARDGSPALAQRLLEICEREEFRDSVTLGELALAATEICLQRRLARKSWRSVAERDEIAHLWNRLASRLVALGRWEESLAADEKAVALRRRLASRRPASIPDLAESLNNLGLDLGRLGRHDEAIQAVGEALQLYRRLVDEGGETHLPGLAACLNNLSNQKSEVGAWEEALALAAEGMQHYRQLNRDDPSFGADLAMSLTNLGNRLSELARHEESLEVTHEAVAWYRELAADRPWIFLPDLARSLHDLGATLRDLGRPKESEAAIREALAFTARQN